MEMIDKKLLKKYREHVQLGNVKILEKRTEDYKWCEEHNERSKLEWEARFPDRPYPGGGAVPSYRPLVKPTYAGFLDWCVEKGMS